MRLFLTGAAGFVGSRVARAAAEQGMDVLALVRPGGRAARLAELPGRVRVLPGTLEELPELSRRLESFGADCCLHLAWYAVPGRFWNADENLDSLAAGLTLLRCLRRAGCPRLVAAGTCAEYAPSDEPLTEESPLAPASLYAVCKAAFRSVALQFGAGAGAGFAWCRLFNLYGPGEDERRLVPYVARSLRLGKPCLLSAGTQVRDYLHVDDAAAALLAVATAGIEGDVNVASGEGMTVRALAELLGDLAGRRDLLGFGAATRDGEPARVVADVTRLHATGWRPRRSLREGLREVLECAGP